MADMAVTEEPGANEWAQGWPIVLASLVGIMLCLSPLPYWALIVIGPELEREFGWSRIVWSSGFLYMTAGVLVAAPIVGTLVDRIGARRVLLPSIVALGLGTMAFSQITADPRVFYLVFFLTAVLGTGTLPITWTKAIVNNFDRYRGLALGIALTGTGLYGFIATPTIQWLIDNFGWRTAYVCVGALPLLLSLPLAFFLFRDEREAQALDGTGGTARPLLIGADIALALFEQVHAQGRGLIAQGSSSEQLLAHCQATERLEGQQGAFAPIELDPTYTLRAWAAVVSYLALDPQFLYHW